MHPRTLSCALLVWAALAAAAPNAPAAAPYDPTLDGMKQLRAAEKEATEEGKRILVIVGGNWCKWCRALDGLMTSDSGLHGELARFVIVHVNYSKENKNPEAMARLGNPDKLGFPSLLVLASNLRVLHTQASGVFETGDPGHPGHDPAKLLAFLEQWDGAK